MTSGTLAGDRAAEEELTHRYTLGLSVIIRKIVPHCSATRDLRQNALRLTRERASHRELDEAESLPEVVASLARDLALNHLRWAKRAEKHAQRALESPLVETAQNQLGLTLHKEKLAAVRKTLEGWRQPRDADVLCRFLIAQEQRERICADLDLSALHFNRVLYRALARVSELLEKEHPLKDSRTHKRRDRLR